MRSRAAKQTGQANGRANGRANGQYRGDPACVAAPTGHGLACDGAADDGDELTPEAQDILVRARRRFTPERQELFWEAFIESLNIAHSAKAAGISLTTFHRWRRDNPAFAARYQEASEDGIVMIEMKALEVALHGETTETESVTDGNGKTIKRTRRVTVASVLRLIEAHRARLAAQSQQRKILTAEEEAAAMPPEQVAVLAERMRADLLAMTESADDAGNP